MQALSSKVATTGFNCLCLQILNKKKMDKYKSNKRLDQYVSVGLLPTMHFITVNNVTTTVNPALLHR